MLEFKEIDYDANLDQIIILINKYLDPNYTLMDFKWKHLENPFGKSYGLVAWDGNNIVGLRMFMFWNIKMNDEKITAIRPVDTFTVENYRRKGIFKDLTLLGLKNNVKKYQLIFNTPNKKSLPALLKMGWNQKDDIGCFKVGIVNPFKQQVPYSLISIKNLKLSNIHRTRNFCTFISAKYLIWRFRDPEFKIASFENENYIIYKKIKYRNFPILVIYEILGNSSAIQLMLNTVGVINKIPFIYYYDDGSLNQSFFLKTFKRNKPVVVIKEDKTQVGPYLRFSLGDLDGKL